MQTIHCPTDPKSVDQRSTMERMLGKGTGKTKGSELVSPLSYQSGQMTVMASSIQSGTIENLCRRINLG